MHWQSLSDFLAMGGYGFYVWGSFGATAVCLAGELLWVRHRHAAALKQTEAPGGRPKS